MTDGFLGQVLATALSGILSILPAASTPTPAVPSPPPAAPSQAPAAPPLVSRLGADISWPNCPRGLGIPSRRTLGKPLPSPSATYVLIGLTNGPAFHPNPCLRDQVDLARRRHLWTSAYAVVNYPTPAQLAAYGGPEAAGRAQAEQNVAAMRAAGLESPTVWLDVEPVRPPAPWSGDTAANRVVLEGSMAAYRAAGLRIGVYSTPYLWGTVVGDVDYGLPEWRAAGPTSEARALAVCAGPDIQGGEPLIGQWSTVDVDLDILCPGRPPIQTLRRHFAPAPG